jgi:hypothetical protein
MGVRGGIISPSGGVSKTILLEEIGFGDALVKSPLLALTAREQYGTRLWNS